MSDDKTGAKTKSVLTAVSDPSAIALAEALKAQHMVAAQNLNPINGPKEAEQDHAIRMLTAAVQEQNRISMDLGTRIGVVSEAYHTLLEDLSRVYQKISELEEKLKEIADHQFKTMSDAFIEQVRINSTFCTRIRELENDLKVISQGESLNEQRIHEMEKWRSRRGWPEAHEESLAAPELQRPSFPDAWRCPYCNKFLTLAGKTMDTFDNALREYYHHDCMKESSK